MLKSLYIKNYVLIDELHVDFGLGLNIITGETGAGKSIIVGALGVILGDSPDKDAIRDPSTKSIFEAELSTERLNIRYFLEEQEIEDFSGSLLIRRELNDSGRTRSFINDTPVPLRVLSELGDLLIDVHGQHQHQQLLRPKRHIDYLDAYANLIGEREKLKSIYQQLREAQKERKKIVERQHELEQSRDYLEFQLKEIKAIQPEKGEDDALEQEERILGNAEYLYEKTTSMYRDLYEKQGAVVEVLKGAEKALSQLGEIDQSFSSLQSECENARIAVEDIATALQRYSSDITFDPHALEKIRQRMLQINGLKKKYGHSIENILERKAHIEKELSLIGNVDENIEKLDKQIENTRQELSVLCDSLSQKRHQAADGLSRKVNDLLAQLGMEKAQFSVHNTYKYEPEEPYVKVNNESMNVTSKGIDNIEFFIVSNKGEEERPLASIASGGEISRVMLALKSLLAESDNVPVLVFDEIDAGVSGRIAQAVGKTLRHLAKSHQILSITHLPQIASMAHHHYVVEKSSGDGHTRTAIHKLESRERIENIAQLLGGREVTNTYLQSASALIEEAEKLADE